MSVDGRNSRRDVNRAKIVDAMRAELKAGNFKVPMVAIAKITGLSPRGVFYFFNEEGLRTEALLDGVTRETIVGFICPNSAVAEEDKFSLCRAVVLGGVA